MDYENIELETAMRSPNLYRSTPYQFALTAEPRQYTVTCGQIVSGQSTTMPRFGPPSQPLPLGPLVAPVTVETEVANGPFAGRDSQ